MAPPPENVSVIVPRWRIAFGEFDRQQIERCGLIGLIEVAALAADDPLEAQRGAATPIVRANSYL